VGEVVKIRQKLRDVIYGRSQSKVNGSENLKKVKKYCFQTGLDYLNKELFCLKGNLNTSDILIKKSNIFITN